MQILTIQHGDFFENFSVASSTGPRESYAADEELCVPHVCNIVADSWRFGFLVELTLFSWRESVSVISLPRPISKRLIIWCNTWDRSRGKFCR